jgi:hypothetical protein
MEKEIAALPGYVRMELRRGELPGLLTAYRELATVCLEQGANAALVVSAPGDPTTPIGLRAGLTAMCRRGTGSGFKLALVARTGESQKMYRLADIDSASGGMRVKVFWSEYQAAAWVLGARLMRMR